MKTRGAVLILAAMLGWPACEQASVAPTTGGVSAIDAADVVGQMAVAFLNRFAASSVTPTACLVDFSDACRGKRDELSDIEYNRAHYEIVGARLGPAAVQLTGNGAGANISVPCAFDSRVTKCENTGCVTGLFEHVAGTCILTGVREQSLWRLCTSNFAASASLSPSFQAFFGPRSVSE